MGFFIFAKIQTIKEGNKVRSIGCQDRERIILLNCCYIIRHEQLTDDTNISDSQIVKANTYNRHETNNRGQH